MFHLGDRVVGNHTTSSADSAPDIANWLIGEGRLYGDGLKVVEGLATRLLASGVPLARMRINHQVANPLIVGWSTVWTADGAIENPIPASVLQTSAWHGSPFQHVVQNRGVFRRRLDDLHPVDDHGVLHEMADAGGTDFFAMALSFSDGSTQGASFVTKDPRGFSERDLELLQSLRDPIAAAMEPCAQRRSMRSLLATYLGRGPAKEVAEGAIRRGDLVHMDAVVMFSDLRDFTAKSAYWPEAELIEAVNDYFEIVAEAVQARDGDILKFLGDGVLSVFPVSGEKNQEERCIAAAETAIEIRANLHALNERRQTQGKPPLETGTGIHMGQVTYGNVGSRDRLDFTVIGPAVNLASRVEHLCKATGDAVLATSAVADFVPSLFRSTGMHAIRGLDQDIETFALI